MTQTGGFVPPSRRPDVLGIDSVNRLVMAVPDVSQAETFYPWGSYAEYACDMDFVAVGHGWRNTDHAAEDAFHVWRPAPRSDFAIDCESAASVVQE